MSIFNDKSLKGVAEEAAKVMEELKGKQHKLDVAEPKGKLTKDDFDKLRSMKKKDVDESYVPYRAKYKGGVAHTDKDLKKLHANVASGSDEHKKRWDHLYGNELAHRADPTLKGRMDKLTGVKEAKDYDAPAPDPEAVARRKRLQALQDKREDEAMEKGAKKDKPTIRKVAGKAYGGAKQKDEMDESVSTFSGILENYAQNGLKSFSSIFLKEEPDNEQFTKEVETAQEKSEGKGKKAKVGAAAVQAVEVQKEEAEQIDELSTDTLKSYAKKAHQHMLDKADKMGERKGSKADWKRISGIEKAKSKIYSKGANPFNEEAEQIDELSTDTLKSYKSKAQDDAFKSMTRRTRAHQMAHQGDDEDLEKAEKTDKEETKNIEKRNAGIKMANQKLNKEEFDMDDINDINGVKMSNIDERELSDAEMQKREQYAKGMKKKLSGFKKRYGERAKEVMYATATKMAKKD
jgi:hypothetical protein